MRKTMPIVFKLRIGVRVFGTKQQPILDGKGKRGDNLGKNATKIRMKWTLKVFCVNTRTLRKVWMESWNIPWRNDEEFSAWLTLFIVSCYYPKIFQPRDYHTNRQWPTNAHKVWQRSTTFNKKPTKHFIVLKSWAWAVWVGNDGQYHHGQVKNCQTLDNSVCDGLWTNQYTQLTTTIILALPHE